MQTNVAPVMEVTSIDRTEAERSMAKNAIWAGVGFVGASAVAAGFMLLSRGGEQLSNITLSILLVGFGSYAASYAWKTASRALSNI